MANAQSAEVVVAPRANIAIPAGTLAEGLFEGVATSTFLEGLAVLSGTVVAGVVLGATIFPAPTSGLSQGTIPGDPNLRYSLNVDEGVLRFLHSGGSGDELVAAARLGREGIFFETETGTPVARLVGGSIVFDPQSLALESADERGHTRAKTSAASELDKPQLCPDPGSDVPHGASARAIAYQAYISFLNNPQRPLPPGMAVSLYDPRTGRRVVYDDCREADGAMIEAKGPGYAKLLRYKYFASEIFPARWTKQADRQVAASGWRDVEWWFAERSAADRADEIFWDQEKLRKVRVITKAME